MPSSGAYTTEDISRGTHVTRTTFKPSSEAPSYVTLPRGEQGWKGDVDENFNSTYVSEGTGNSFQKICLYSGIWQVGSHFRLYVIPLGKKLSLREMGKHRPCLGEGGMTLVPGNKRDNPRTRNILPSWYPCCFVILN